MDNYENIYSEQFDLSKIKSDDKKEFMRTALKDFPVAGAVLLHIFTLGIFSLIYYGIAHSKFPKSQTKKWDLTYHQSPLGLRLVA